MPSLLVQDMDAYKAKVRAQAKRKIAEAHAERDAARAERDEARAELQQMKESANGVSLSQQARPRCILIWYAREIRTRSLVQKKNGTLASTTADSLGTLHCKSSTCVHCLSRSGGDSRHV